MLRQHWNFDLQVAIVRSNRGDLINNLKGAQYFHSVCKLSRIKSERKRQDGNMSSKKFNYSSRLQPGIETASIIKLQILGFRSCPVRFGSVTDDPI